MLEIGREDKFTNEWEYAVVETNDITKDKDPPRGPGCYPIRSEFASPMSGMLARTLVTIC